MAHDVSLTYSRFEHMPPAALALTVLLHVGVGLALYWISPLRPVEPREDVIEVSMEAPAPLPPIPEAKPEAPPVAPPAPPPAASAPPPPPAAPTPTPSPPAPPMRLGLPPPAAEPSKNPRDVAGAETPAKQATDIPTPDKTAQDGSKEEVRKEEPRPEAKEEPKPEPKAEAKRAEPEPPPPPPQQQAMARPEPVPPPPPPPSLEQALPPLEAPPPPVTERDVPKPLPVPRPAPPPPQQAVRPPPPPPPAPRPAPQPPAHSQPAPRPSPLNAPPAHGETQSAARQSSPTFQNPADTYGQKRAQEQYLWQVMRRISQFPYVPKETGPVRTSGTVLARVTISRDGRLLDVAIERSSGLTSLDHGVMDTIRRASPYPPLPADITGDRHTFQLPVSFNFNQQR